MFKKMLGVLAILSLGACATPYVATPYDRASANVRQIVLVDDSAPEAAVAYEVASMGSNFGLIGALVDAGIQAERRAALNKSLGTVQFDAEKRLETRIIERLQGDGYQVTALEGTMRAKREFMVTYPVSGENQDAYLDLVVIDYGYLSAGAFQPFRPHASATVRLVSASDPTKVLMDNRIVYNSMYPNESVINISPNPRYEFRNREELLADPTRTAAGIEDALNQLADTAAQLLR